MRNISAGRHRLALFRWLVRFAVFAACAGVNGCVKQPYPPGRLVVQEVTLEGSLATDDDEILDGLTTHSSPRFLGIWDGVAFEYELLDEALLARDLRRIERRYHALGYYEAKVTAARVRKIGAHHARVQIVVHEGPAVITEAVEVQGVESLPLEIATATIKAISIRSGKPFLEASYEESKAELRSVLGDNGYAFAQVVGKVSVELATHRARVRFSVTPGRSSRYGPVTLLGLKEIPAGPIRETLLFREGDVYDAGELKDAEDALSALGVFSKIEVRQDRSEPGTGTVPITILVEESKLRTFSPGVGATADALRLALGGRVGWEDRNALGGLRRLSVDARPGVTFFPARIGNLIPSKVVLLPEVRSQLVLRQPSFLEGRTTGFARAQFNIVPYLFVFNGDPAGAKVLGFRESKFALGLERAFLGHHLLVTPSYNLDFRSPFIYRGDSLKQDIIASFPEFAVTLDFRDNPLQPHKGLSLSLSAQANNQVFGGSSDDLRIYPELRAFWPLSRRVVLAVRGGYGHLFSYNEPDDSATRQLLRLVRGFYSGGPGSNRGYAFQGVNSQAPLEVLTKDLNCGDPTAPRQQCRLQPKGAAQLWEGSTEVRFPLLGPLSGVAFADASGVSEPNETFGFATPHLSVGPGLRYLTPVGPVRADLGVRLPGLQGPSAASDAPLPELLGLPAAVHLSLGEDF